MEWAYSTPLDPDVWKRRRPWPCRCGRRSLTMRCTARCQRDMDGASPYSEELTAAARLSRCGHVAGRISLNRKQHRSITGAQTSLYERLESWCSCNNNIINTTQQQVRQEILANVHETRDRLSRSISSDFGAVHAWNVCGSLKSPKKSLKTHILGYKVVQGHRCWYH